MAFCWSLTLARWETDAIRESLRTIVVGSDSDQNDSSCLILCSARLGNGSGFYPKHTRNTWHGNLKRKTRIINIFKDLLFCIWASVENIGGRRFLEERSLLWGNHCPAAPHSSLECLGPLKLWRLMLKASTFPRALFLNQEFSELG